MKNKIIATITVIMFSMGLTACVMDAPKDIETDTISIVHGEKHSLAVTDKTADKVYNIRRTLIKKTATHKPEPLQIDTDTISIESDKHIVYINDKVGNQSYTIK